MLGDLFSCLVRPVKAFGTLLATRKLHWLIYAFGLLSQVATPSQALEAIGASEPTLAGHSCKLRVFSSGTGITIIDLGTTHTTGLPQPPAVGPNAYLNPSTIADITGFGVTVLTQAQLEAHCGITITSFSLDDADTTYADETFYGMTFSTATHDYIFGLSDPGGTLSSTTLVNTQSLRAVAPTVTDGNISITSSGSGTGGAYKVGDTVTASWNNTAGGDNNSGLTNVTMDFTSFGGGNAVATTNTSETYTANYVIQAGSIDGTSQNVSVSATNASGTTTVADTTGLTVDNQAPTLSDARISISGASGTGGAFKVGDTLTATWTDTGGDNNADTISSVTVNFSAFGGGSAVSASNNSGVWTAAIGISAGSLDATNLNLSVTATDNAGNVTTTADTSNATVDNQAPTVMDGEISISGASGTGGAFKIGDTVTATWDNTSATGDGNTDLSSVTVNFSAFGGGSAVAATNSSETYTATFEIVAGAIDGTNLNVSVTATDNAGNVTTTADTSNATVDNQAPTVSDARISISGASGTGGAFKVGDTLTATWTDTGGDNNADTISSVTVNFSAFGGGAAVSASNSSGVWTAAIGISAGSLDATNLNLSVTATDNAGNATTTADTSNATVDNQAPTVSDARISISGASGGGGTYIAGDTVTATWDNTGSGDNNADTISGVTVNFSAFGGGTAVAASESSGTWTATFTIAAGSINASNLNVSVTATDNAGNATTTSDTTNATVDNRDPEISINSSVSGRVDDGNTDAQGTIAAGVAKSVTYTITNSGTAALSLTTPTVGGNLSGATNVTVNSMTLGSTTVAAGGGTTTLIVNYTPSLAGAFSFAFSLTNDDRDENPYNITASGTATGVPEIAVSSSETGAVADGGTDAQGDEVAGSAKVVTYTITNTGLANLSVTTPTVGGNVSGASNVTVNSLTLGATSVTGAGGTTTLQVSYTPTVAGAFSFDLSLTNGDGDENPYNITVSGTGTGAPEIAVTSSESGGAVADGGTDAQGSEVSGATKTVTYTITNSGTEALSLTTPTIGGNISSATNVTVTELTLGATSVATLGGTTTLVVKYVPTIAGAFSFDFSLANTDGDENPYDITVSGTATGTPEIAVSSSESGAVADGGTDAQGNEVAGVAKAVTLTINNVGTDTLTVTTPTVGGNVSGATNVVVNSLTLGSTSVAALGSTTLIVNYTVTTPAAFSFDLSFANTDGDENPYNITLSGTGTGAPEIAVSSSESGAVADGGTDAQGSEAAAVLKSVTYTITNSGNFQLGLTTPTVGGNVASASNVSVSSLVLGATTVAAGGGTTTLVVGYTPTVAGAFSFELSLANTDGDENPYNITVSGTATGAPEIAVSSPELGGAIADGATDPHGNETAGVSKTVTYGISNTGTDTLTLTAPTVAGNISSTSNVTVTAMSLAATTVAAGGSTTLDVTYTPTLAGAFGFDLSLTNDDSDENPYNLSIAGTGVGAPEIAVSSSESGAVADGGTDAQGTEIAGSAKSVTYTITNVGTDNLSITTPTVGGNIASASNVSVASLTLGATTLAGGNTTTTLVVTYTPSAAGAFSFDLSLANSDGDENPYNITVSGTATGAPEIAVSSSESGAVADGGTDSFTTTPVALVAGAVTYTISNTGTDTLTLTTPTVGGNITNASNVTVNSLTLGATSIAVGGTTTLVANYTTPLAGAFSFDLSLANNDSDENPYNVTAAGTASGVPEIALVSSESGAVADGGTDAQGTETVAAPKNVTYTVSNSGTSDLTLVAPTVAGNTSGATNVTINTVSLTSATVAPGASTSFVVNYTPTSAGAFDFDLTLGSDDGDENPYNISVSGTATGTPDLGAESSETGIVATENGTDDQGDEPVSVIKTVIYTFTNNGTTTLIIRVPTVGGNVSGTKNVTVNKILLSLVTANSIETRATTVRLEPGEKAALEVQYTPSSAGDFDFDVNLKDDTSGGDAFSLNVFGTAVAQPEIAVTSSEGGAVADGGTDTFSSTATAGAAASVTYTITNEGAGTLGITAPTVANAITNASRVTVNSLTLGATSVAGGGGTTTLVVNYTPDAGAFGFDLALTNTDADENPFNITVSGSTGDTPETEFLAQLDDVRATVQSDMRRIQLNEMNANRSMMDDALDRFMRRDAASTRNIAFDVDGFAEISPDGMVTKGDFFGLTAAGDHKRHLTFGQFDLARDSDGSVTGQVSARAVTEWDVSSETTLGYFFGGSVNRSNIQGSFSGDSTSLGLVLGGYGVTQMGDNLFANGYLGLGHTWSDMTIASTTLSLDGQFNSTSFYAGFELAGHYTLGQVELRPGVAVDYAHTDIGIVGFDATAFGATSAVSADMGAVSTLTVKATPELIYDLSSANAQGNKRLVIAPSLLCSRETGVSDASACGHALGVAYEAASADGTRNMSLGYDVEQLVSTTRRTLSLSLEMDF